MERSSKGYVSHLTRRIGETAVEQSTARSQRVGDAGCSTPAFKKGKQVVQHAVTAPHFMRLPSIVRQLEALAHK